MGNFIKMDSTKLPMKTRAKSECYRHREQQRVTVRWNFT